MDPDQTAPTALFVYEALNILVEDKSIHYVITHLKG